MSGTEEKQSLTPEFQRKLAMIAFWGTIIAALIGAAASVLVTWLTILPRLPAQEYVYYAKIPASAYPFINTNVNVERGDEVEIIVEGLDAHWDCGTGKTSAEGRFRDSWEGHLVPSATQCELIGYIQEGVFFRIGTYERFMTDKSGFLYMGANDRPDRVFPDDPGKDETFFDDNSGELSVKIVVKRE